jgi:hypothetical protein
VFHSDDDHKSDVSQRREGVDSVVSLRMVSFSTSTTISHVTLPITRDARGEKAVGRPEPGDEEEGDDKDSARTSPGEWV